LFLVCILKMEGGGSYFTKKANMVHVLRTLELLPFTYKLVYIELVHGVTYLYLYYFWKFCYVTVNKRCAE
jgi:hypothetical protein